MQRLQSRLPSLIIFCFGLYKTTETLLQTSVRLQVYHLVCKWLTNSTIREYLCSPMANYKGWTNISDTPAAILGLVELDNRIQRTSVPYIVTYRVLLNLPAMVTCLVLGTLSDTHGRKTTFLAPIVGGALACCLFGVSLIRALPPVPDGVSCLLIGALVYGLAGKSNSFGMGANSYITDCSNEEKRTVYISHLMGANFIGLCIGSGLLSLFLFFTDFGWILLFVCLTNLVIFTLILVFIQESVIIQPDLGDYGSIAYAGNNGENEDQAKSDKRFIQILYSACVTSYKFLVTKRSNNANVYLRCLFGAVLFNQITKAGEQDAIMLYVTRTQVGWSDTLYATGVSHNTYVLFISAVFGSSAGYITTGTRSLISKLVKEDEVGTGFAFMSVLETFANLFGSLLFTSVYASTLSVYPGLVFLMDAMLHGCLFFVMLWLSVRLRAYFAVTNSAT
ncbi:unnamed protein product [Dibothriocephalus latus]|uniref:Major facilitator superfamily (MFS) profile domain-containing protein n=1 Tax=Dibothriocephalus latus TaxID=60516 RepID=A0A3P7P952_DIBLA|nr:unnamed protein product [Dibothriocephalus latus]